MTNILSSFYPGSSDIELTNASFKPCVVTDKPLKFALKLIHNNAFIL